VVLVVSRPLISGAAGALAAVVIALTIGPVLPPLARLLLGGLVLVAVYSWVLLFVMGQKALYLDLLEALGIKATEKSVVNPNNREKATLVRHLSTKRWPTDERT
jgi:hypothetical protein